MYYYTEDDDKIFRAQMAAKIEYEKGYKKGLEDCVLIMGESVLDAVNYIKSYCQKHRTCENSNCKLYRPDIGCIVAGCNLPCDWEVSE